MTNQGDSVTRLQVRLVLDYSGKDSHRALEKWIPDALDRYFNADKSSQMYVEEISVTPAEPVPPVPEGLERGDLGRCECGHTKLDPAADGERHYFGDTANKNTMCLVDGCTCRHFKPAERPAEGTEDVVDEVREVIFQAVQPLAEKLGWNPLQAIDGAQAAILSLIQHQRAAAVEADREARAGETLVEFDVPSGAVGDLSYRFPPNAEL